MKNILNIHITDLKDMETHRGVAYSAKVWMNGKEIGLLSYPGDGSYTRVNILENEFVFKEKVIAYFEGMGWNPRDEQEYALYYTFAEHLIDMYEEGKITKERLEIGFLC